MRSPWRGLSLRARRALNALGIMVPSHAAEKSRESLIYVRGVGKKTLWEIEQFLGARGFSLQ
jgi:hypothetical protein